MKTVMTRRYLGSWFSGLAQVSLWQEEEETPQFNITKKMNFCWEQSTSVVRTAGPGGPINPGLPGFPAEPL